MKLDYTDISKYLLKNFHGKNFKIYMELLLT